MEPLSIDDLVAAGRLEAPAPATLARLSVEVARQHIRAVSLLEHPVPALAMCAVAGRRALVAAAAHRGFAVVVREPVRESELEEALLVAATGASPALDELIPVWQQLVLDAEAAGITKEVTEDDVAAATALAESMIDIAIAMVDGDTP
ncbi:hypothetical protein [Cellulomonas sp. KRMCY2]|uniref:hypothetical protein n=1 Tax=Cellulomonas sp. KRMCY2 TaxID=1304865 RepID=UPI00045EA6B4|nr:hypothetical protein [Cellulomonas sp. KRMCY2]